MLKPPICRLPLKPPYSTWSAIETEEKDSSETRLQNPDPTRTDLPRIIVLGDVDTQIRYFQQVLAWCLVRHHCPVLAFPSAQTNLVLLHSYFCYHSRLHTHIPHLANPRTFFESRPVPKRTNFEPCGKSIWRVLRGSDILVARQPNPHNFRCIIGSAQQLHRPGPVPDLYKKSQPSLVCHSAYISSDFDPC
jgi:hypothetical protein